MLAFEDICATLKETNTKLSARVIDLESCIRIRIIDLPESIEGPRPTACSSELLVEKERIAHEARVKRGKLQYRGSAIAMFEDYAPEVLKQRAKY
ncbi:hypothetical protein AOLI_G00160530 [Acnodon oligacanthus]